MRKRLTATVMLLIFVLTAFSACVVKHVPPGQIKKLGAPGQLKKNRH